MNAAEVEQKVVAEADKVRAEIKSDAEAAIGTVKTDAGKVESKAVALWHKCAPWIIGAALSLGAIVFFIAKHKH